MKHYFLLIFSTFIFAQGQTQVIVSNEKMNIVYAGVDNPIEFLANNIEKSQLVIKASCGVLSRTSTGKYIWRICTEDSQFVRFSIGILKNKIFKLIGFNDYRIKKIPPPISNFTSTPESRASSQYSNSSVKIPQFGPALYLENFDFNVKFQVKRFTVDIYKKNGDTLHFTNIGLKFNEEIMHELEYFSVGEKLCVKNLLYTFGCEVEEHYLSESFCFVY